MGVIAEQQNRTETHMYKPSQTLARRRCGSRSEVRARLLGDHAPSSRQPGFVPRNTFFGALVMADDVVLELGGVGQNGMSSRYRFGFGLGTFQA